jgi:8-oxo-dGTP pyrophosphatase MutT (NUDIX family)
MDGCYRALVAEPKSPPASPLDGVPARVLADVRARVLADVRARVLADVGARVLADVRARQPVDGREADSIGQFLAVVPGLDRPFDEHAHPTHVTGSAIVVGPRGTVLHRHKRLGIWLQPGGHIEPGETPWEAALREAAEETGLPVRFAGGGPALVHVDVHPGPRGHTHFDLRYLLESDHVDPEPGDGESPHVAWFGWPDAIARADAGLRGGLSACARALGIRVDDVEPAPTHPLGLDPHPPRLG